MSDIIHITAEVFSGVALAVSGYSLWYTSLKSANLKLFVPPLIRYASPYQNSVFEVFEVPITIHNEGARTGTILSFELFVTNTQTQDVKKFYSAGIGAWNLSKARAEGLHPFAPIAVNGRDSKTQTVLFYARHDSTVMQIIDRAADYDFMLVPVTAQQKASADLALKAGRHLHFKMNLPFLDHRAFTSGDGTLPLNHPDWQATANS